ncbi:hypothetical protein HK103_006257 [Boothiomyces macroporosus]|uniref:DUF642 domain-containing protein n=1 Tax=Boothiomyces macroporosus TaxID=261099 RepID=A0AAD5UHU3_9FUNG|nr:hypothetical protein HK103_006257 [Boothiomyces macroporosus]
MSNNLVQNGSFEDLANAGCFNDPCLPFTFNNFITPWKFVGDDLFTKYELDGPNTWQAFDGDWSLALASTIGPYTIAQDIAVTPGSTYTLQFMTRADSRGGSLVKKGAYGIDGLDQQSFSISGSTWTPVVYTFTATDSVATVYFSGVGKSTFQPVIDAVKITPAKAAAPVLQIPSVTAGNTSPTNPIAKIQQPAPVQNSASSAQPTAAGTSSNSGNSNSGNTVNSNTDSNGDTVGPGSQNSHNAGVPVTNQIPTSTTSNPLVADSASKGISPAVVGLLCAGLITALVVIGMFVSAKKRRREPSSQSTLRDRDMDEFQPPILASTPPIQPRPSIFRKVSMPSITPLLAQTQELKSKSAEFFKRKFSATTPIITPADPESVFSLPRSDTVTTEIVRLDTAVTRAETFSIPSTPTTSIYATMVADLQANPVPFPYESPVTSQNAPFDAQFIVIKTDEEKRMEHTDLSAQPRFECEPKEERPLSSVTVAELPVLNEGDLPVLNE